MTPVRSGTALPFDWLGRDQRVAAWCEPPYSWVDLTGIRAQRDPGYLQELWGIEV
jgi:hypothetical protein